MKPFIEKSLSSTRSSSGSISSLATPSEEDPRKAELRGKIEKASRELEEWNKKVENLDARNKANLHNIQKLRYALRRYKKVRDAADYEKELWAKEREHLKTSVSELEASLAFKKKKWARERERVTLIMKESEVAHQKNLSLIRTNCEEQQKVVERAKQRKLDTEKRLQKTTQQVAYLTSVLRQQKMETEKIKQENDGSNDPQLQTIRELQLSLKCCIKEKKIAELQRDNAIRDREQLETRLAQLEDTLAPLRLLSKEVSEFLAIHLDTKKKKKKWMTPQYRVKQIATIFGRFTPVLKEKDILSQMDFRNILHDMSISELEEAIQILDEQEAAHWHVQYAKM